MFDANHFHLVKTLNKRAFETGYPDNPVTTQDYNDWRALGHTVGVMTGVKGGLYVVDVDDIDAATETLLRWDLPPTLLVDTPSGGYHYYFSYDGPVLPRKIRPFPGIDLLGKGGYANCHLDPKGGYSQYDTGHIARMPAALLENWQKASQQTSSDKVLTLEPGGRNNAIASLAGSLLKGGTPLQDAHDHLQGLNAQTPQPLSKGEVARTVASVSRYHPSAPPAPNASDESEDASIIKTTKLADVQPKPVDWLWDQRIARGKVTLITGDPDKGKSLITVAIAAAVSRGAPWPVGGGNAPLGNVLMLTAEDDLADTVRPRLDAAGADVSRIEAITTITGIDKDGRSVVRMPTLREDLEKIDRLLSRRSFYVLTIDPLSAYLQGVDTHRNADVRSVLAPLQDIAQRHHVAVVCVEHLNKGQGKAMYRVSGSLAFVAAARTTFVVGLDENDPERRLMIPVKNNLAKDKVGMAFSIISRDEQPILAWESDPVLMTADEILMQPIGDERSAQDDAVQFLSAELNRGPVEAGKLIKSARAAGISETTLRRAKSKIRIESRRRAFSGGWEWWLPDDLPSNDADVSP